MSASYSGDPSYTAQDFIRFLIGDTEPSSALVSDEEISAVLVINHDPYAAASIICDAQASKYARLTQMNVGQTSVNYGQLMTQFTTMADRFKTIAARGVDGKGAIPAGAAVDMPGGGGETYLGPDDTPATYGEGEYTGAGG